MINITYIVQYFFIRIASLNQLFHQKLVIFNFRPLKNIADISLSRQNMPRIRLGQRQTHNNVFDIKNKRNLVQIIR